eukprot:1270013-Pleurochrysis_carterae.AAC.1
MPSQPCTCGASSLVSIQRAHKCSPRHAYDRSLASSPVARALSQRGIATTLSLRRDVAARAHLVPEHAAAREPAAVVEEGGRA